MIKIAIVDDEQKCVEDVKELLLELEYTLDIDEFNDGEELLKKEIIDYDIVFLDVEMPNMLGVDLAEEIMLKKPEIIIFFITSHNQYVSQAFKTGIFQYLTKPIDKKLFKEEFTRAIKILTSQKSEIEFSFNGQLVKEKIGDILYIESYNRKNKVHTKTDERIDTSCKLSDLEKVLEEFSFVRCHVGFIVNMAFIHMIKRNEILLHNGFKISISKKYLKSVHEQFRVYLSKVAL